jgi:hypothetical protein
MSGRANRLRQGYGGPPKLYAEAEALRYQTLDYQTLDSLDFGLWTLD